MPRTPNNLITSVANERVKYAKSLARKKNWAAQREFVLEGTRLIEEAERAGSTPALVFFDPEAVSTDERARDLMERLKARSDRTYEVDSKVLRYLAETESPQGVIAVYPFPQLPIPPTPALLLIADKLGDPGNLGTILRTAWAAGVDAVLLAPATADSFNPKAVRAAMGAHFFVPVVEQSWQEIDQRLAVVPRVYLAAAKGDVNYAVADWSAPCALIIGGEAEGASEQAGMRATKRVYIPMPGRSESLNAAVAAGVLLFEAVKQQSRIKH